MIKNIIELIKTKYNSDEYIYLHEPVFLRETDTKPIMLHGRFGKNYINI